MKEIQIISSFEHSVSLEIAIDQLEERGIGKENIVAVPLDQTKTSTKFFDTIHRSDGKSLLDLAAVLGTVFSVLGASYGFSLEWGPIIWGLLGLACGIVVGLILDYIFTKTCSAEKTGKYRSHFDNKMPGAGKPNGKKHLG